ncbi:DUF1878 family protein [Sutcliffiella halmapala]|uniref:DUF1878 family protein n=1 Tax=Sutcliffiella halmapala TaxID=79882 RepID=UPI000994D64E|nr:DUF1878 family protein [Sutcliffiella halmapala]
MSNLEERMAKLEYHMELLLKQVRVDQYPFDILVIRGKLSRDNVTYLLKLCEELSIEMKKQKAEGFVTFTPLLTKYKQLLHPNLPLEETIQAMYEQGMFEPLMLEFLKLIKKK